MESTGPAGGEYAPPAIDPNVPHAARVYDYMLGGDVNFAVDRAAAEQAAAAVGGMDNVRSEVRANRAFLGRAVRFALDRGVRQFLDIGTGIPNRDNVHHVALAVTADVRIVYADKDPIVLAHAHELLRGTGDATVYLQADFEDPEDIRARAAATLDFSEPVAVLLIGLLHHFDDADDPQGLVRRVTDGLAPGSLVAVSHLASDIQVEEMTAAGEQLKAMNVPWVPRTRPEVAALLAGLDPVEPGVVQVDTWRPDGNEPPRAENWTNPLYVGMVEVR
jgi:hypothetical protein